MGVKVPQRSRNAGVELMPQPLTRRRSLARPVSVRRLKCLPTSTTTTFKLAPQ